MVVLRPGGQQEVLLKSRQCYSSGMAYVSTYLGQNNKMSEYCFISVFKEGERKERAGSQSCFRTKFSKSVQILPLTPKE
jgi:hypothetical protein